MNIVSIVKNIINPFKMDIVKYPNSDLRRRKKCKKYGFSLYSLENDFFKVKTGQLLQIDGIFLKD